MNYSAAEWIAKRLMTAYNHSTHRKQLFAFPARPTDSALVTGARWRLFLWTVMFCSIFTLGDYRGHIIQYVSGMTIWPTSAVSNNYRNNDLRRCAKGILFMMLPWFSFQPCCLKLHDITVKITTATNTTM